MIISEFFFCLKSSFSAPFPSPAIFFCLTFVSPLLPSLFLTPSLSSSHSFTPLPPVVCFDAKINFDDNAEFRQKAVFAMDDMTESDPTEMEAAKWDLKYIGLDGNIACFGMETTLILAHRSTHASVSVPLLV